MKKLFLSLCLLLCAAGLRAQSAASLVVEMCDGQQVAFSLSAQPEVSFAASTLCLTSTDGSLSVELSGVSQILFRQTATSISPATGATTFRQTSRHTVEVTHPTSTAVGLFDASGRRLLTSARSAPGHTVIDLSLLPAGTYIVRAGKYSFKLIH